ncbi:MAG: molybdate ABC transporter permease subunit, partial [Myxococcota bacterium]
MSLHRFSPASALATVLGTSLVLCLAVPFLALALSTSFSDLRAAFAHPMFAPALKLSLGTSIASLGLTALLGTPLGWWLATTSSRVGRITEIAVQLPIIVP